MKKKMGYLHKDGKSPNYSSKFVFGITEGKKMF